MPRDNNRKMQSTAMYETILKLETVEECVEFFEDLCAATELRALEQRFQVATMLLQGKVYAEIMQATGASSATISRVNRMLDAGHGTEEKLIKRTNSQPEG